MEYLIFAIILGLVPATIASKKGRSFLLWWFCGAMLFIVALPMAIIAKPLNSSNLSGLRRCPKCAEEIQLEALICKHCKSEIEPLHENGKKMIIKNDKRKDYVPGWLVLLVFICIGVFIWFLASSDNLYDYTSSKSSKSFFSSNYTIKVSGTEGLGFSGSYMAVTATGKSTAKSVEGKVPQTYHTSGSIVSMSFQKQSTNGVLMVQIIKDGKVVSSSDTTAAYGVVTAATN